MTVPQFYKTTFEVVIQILIICLKYIDQDLNILLSHHTGLNKRNFYLVLLSTRLLHSRHNDYNIAFYIGKIPVEHIHVSSFKA